MAKKKIECQYCDDCCEMKPLADGFTHVASCNREVCKSCLEDYYRDCGLCGECFPSDDLLYVDDIGYDVCDDCRSENCTFCHACGNYFDNDNTSYSESHEEYYCNDCFPESFEEDTVETGLFRYHSRNGRENKAGRNRFRVGIEIEKEDAEQRRSLVPRDVLKEIGWVMETDGSLLYGGFEAVSPIYPLSSKRLEKIFNQETIKKIIQANGSRRCGGHMTISDKGKTPVQLMRSIAGYSPLLYAMFPRRVNGNYCQARGIKHYTVRNPHTIRGAFNPRNSRRGGGLEIRLFDSPTSVEDLLLRCKTLEFMVRHQAKNTGRVLKYLSSSDELYNLVSAFLKIKNMNLDTFFSNLVEFTTRFNDENVEAVAKEVLEKVKSK